MMGDLVRGSSPLSKRQKLDQAFNSSQSVLSEADVGISGFMYAKNAGFQGTMKGRYVVKFEWHCYQMGGFPRSRG